MENPSSEQPYKKGTYGKRPMWQWIVLYLIIGGIVYYGIYYFAVAKKGGYQNSNTTNSQSGSYY